MIARTGSVCASGRTAVPRHTNHATVNQNARDLNSPNELRHAQLTRKFVRKQPVFTSERTSRGRPHAPSPWEGEGRGEG